MESSNKTNYFYISVLTVVSSFAVVMLHCNGIFWEGPTGSHWLSATIIETLFYFAVPIFFMISGCTLIDYKKRYGTKEFFIKRATKAGIPFIVWSLVALGVTLYESPEKEISLIGDILNHRYMGIYWFFMPLFAIYLCIPVLADIKNKVPTFTYMASLGLVTISTFGFMRDWGVQDIPISLNSPICGGFLIYPLLGYILHHQELSKKVRITIYILGLASTISHFSFTYICSLRIGVIYPFFKNYTYITTVLQACAVFVFIKQLSHQLEKLNMVKKAILYIQPAALGIYLTHSYAISLFVSLGIAPGSILFRTIGAIIIYLVLALVIRQLQKVRWLHVILP